LTVKPVIAKSDDWPEGCEENRKFWEASPSGEMELRYGGETPFQLGDFIYVDMTPAEDDEEENLWKLYSVTQSETQLSIEFGLGWDHERYLRSAQFKLDIHNEGAWDAFLGNHGTKWKVTLTKCDGQHDGCPVTGPQM
jgi:hypothetical protein